jgi:membrane protease YdiL (CAAX protease family)
MLERLRKLLTVLLPLSLFAQAQELPTLSEPDPEVGEVALGESIQVSPISFSLPEPTEQAPFLVKKTKSPTVAVLLSSLVPGLGHYYLGEPRVGSGLLGGALLGGASAYATRNDPSLFATSLYTVRAVGGYGIFAAYRDAKLYNGNPLLTMPRDDFKSLTAAPFQWSVLKKPEVWGACLGALALATTTAYFAYPEDASARIKTTYIEPLSALPIAIGEESIFRGFLQSSLGEVLPPWGAITLSSLAFGAAHIPNAQHLEQSHQWRYYTFSLPLITGLGAYMGWLTHKNHSLKESVALHAWYDFSLMFAGALASKAAIGEKTEIFHSWEF